MSATAQHSPRVLTIEFDRETDGRWIADIPELPGVLVYAATQQEARAKVEALALHVLADQITESGTPQDQLQFVAA